MAKVSELMAGTAVLVFAYLVLSNSKATVSIISQLGGTYAQGVKVLQGRG